MTHKEEMKKRREEQRRRAPHTRIKTGEYIPRLEDMKHLKEGQQKLQGASPAIDQ